MSEVAAHDQGVTNRYIVHYPEHGPRQGDPHYAAFNSFHRRTRQTARCWEGLRLGSSECEDAQGNPAPMPADPSQPQAGLEVHHEFIEFALSYGVDPTLLAKDFPSVHPDATPDEVDAFVESDSNFRWLCVRHHRSMLGEHHVAHADYQGAQYVRNMLGEGCDLRPEAPLQVSARGTMLGSHGNTETEGSSSALC